MSSASLLLDRSPVLSPARLALNRVRTVFLVLAVSSAVLAALYSSYYALLAVRIQLPEVSGTATTMAYGYAVAALIGLLWAWGLGQLGQPAVARSVRVAWRSRVCAERPAWFGWSLAAAVAVVYAGLRFAGSEMLPQARLDVLAAGEATLPFQYRALVPWLVGGAAEAAATVGWDGRFPYTLAFAIVEALAAFGAYAAFRYLLGLFEPLRPGRDLLALAVFAPLAVMGILPVRYNPYYFPWDTPSVAFFTLGLALLYRRQWVGYYVLFVIATLNRETACFLTVAMLFLGLGRERLWPLALHVAVQAALWIAIKYGLYLLYLGNPLHLGDTGLFVSQLGRNFQIAMTLPAYVYLVLAMGGLWVPVLLLRRYLTDRRVRRSLAIVPVFVAGMFVVGEVLEMRVYGELVSLFTLASLLLGHTLVRAVAEEHEPDVAPRGGPSRGQALA